MLTLNDGKCGQYIEKKLHRKRHNIPELIVIGKETEGCVQIVGNTGLIRVGSGNVVLVGHSRPNVSRLPIPNAYIDTYSMLVSQRSEQGEQVRTVELSDGCIELGHHGVDGILGDGNAVYQITRIGRLLI